MPVFKKHGVARAAVFGSFARGEASEDSDLDFLIEFEGQKTLLDLVALRQELEEVIGKKVDVVTYASLNPRMREQIIKEQVDL
ncbi:nucleotidyltransferase family protein [Thermanaeromonas sp.]|uniref:nucleotidyltransferase family protein n=1 Tax=Thermanaeromonas sp. TaxID=2003697 RepID=UPI00260A6556|nr:nucleotidyltransferase family protein [Thermanaeromonas sp.]